MCPGRPAETAHYAYDSLIHAEFEEQIKETATALWEAHSAVKEKGTDPGIVFYKGDVVPEELTAFSKKAETTIVTLKEAMALIKKYRRRSLRLQFMPRHHRLISSHRRNTQLRLHLRTHRVPHPRKLGHKSDVWMRRRFLRWTNKPSPTHSTMWIQRRAE